MASVRRAVVAVYFEKYATLILNFVTLYVSSRLLTPNEIGAAFLGASLVALAEGLRDFGVTNYIVNAEKLSKEEIRTSFTMMLAVAILLTTVFVATAGLYADFTHEPRLENFIRTVAFGYLFSSIGSPIVALLRRDLRFWDIAAINLGSALVGNITTTGLVMMGVGYMSFAWGSLSYPLSTFVFAILMRPDLSIFRIEFTKWREILAFGGLNTATGLLTALGGIIPTFVLGRASGSTDVGLYSRGQQVTEMPSRLVISAISAVALPGFAAHARTGRPLKDPYLKAAASLTAFHWPGLAMVIFFAHPLVLTMLGPQWDTTTPLVQVMAAAAMLSFPVPLMFPALVAAGGIRDTAKAWMISLPITCLIMILAAQHGPLVLALSIFATTPIQVGVGLWFLMPRLNLSVGEYLRALAPSAAATLASTLGPLVVIGLNGFDMNISVLQAILGGVLGGVFWFLAMGWTRHPFAAELAYLLGRAQALAPAWLHPLLTSIRHFLGEATEQGQAHVPADADSGIDLVGRRDGVQSVWSSIKGRSGRLIERLDGRQERIGDEPL
ncbi:MAG TPA: lipopolysaccharide biosynthesis protein [Mesorhizobium sp.]|jgi:O-antigen/teichoic acid export membrane protein|uniref:lipopolysaccharide biosynthesis protein n=1 Tax=Mesorhizobium sp. TaxID=1871066 RepID=UPI002DDCEF8A|nr:lipopolysaccharide biosynthesis protein [Mesorhizobium sp.]HEV2501698.1 lipopolysaccharide biosynthesis protein [Mesorhizobium sp.]